MTLLDVMIAVGARFDDRITGRIDAFSPGSKKIHVDIDPEEIGRNYPVALGLMADVRTFLRQIHAELDRRADIERDLRRGLTDGGVQVGQVIRGLAVLPAGDEPACARAEWMVPLGR